MSDRGGDFWDDLGVTWQAIVPDVRALQPRLEKRLRRQSRWINAGIAAATTASVLGLILAGATLWSGWRVETWNLVIRGVAILVLSILSGEAARWLLTVRSADAGGTLSQMLDLAIQRAVRVVLLARVGLWACATAAVFGLVGTAVRAHLSEMPRMSPVIDLILLALIAVVLVLCGRSGEADLARFERLKHTLAGEEVRQ